MRTLILAIAIIGSSSAFGSQIREFDLKTVARLGAQLARLSDTADKGATNPARKRARDTAVAALKGKLFDIPYKYVVLDDPDGSGFLVYALAGEKPLTVSMSQIVSNRPLETCVYTSLHDKVIVSVGMVNDNAKVWFFVGDKIFEMTPERMKEMGIPSQ